MKDVEKSIAKIFLEMASGLENGSFSAKPKIALTGMGSEHGEENAMKGALIAASKGIEVWYIGSLEAPGVITLKVDNEEEGHKRMDELLDSGVVDGAVTMHYPFPIGVATVGRVVTPAAGKEMFIATTTGTSSAERVDGLVKNALYGISVAKAAGISSPRLGLLNIDGVRQAEIVLNKMRENGYNFQWAGSSRADGGAIMRGNDVLQGTADVLVCDSLTGNVLMKMMSAYTTGGSFESSGYGYGPGIGKGYTKLVSIISRASGAPVIANALLYAADMVKGKLFSVAEEELSAAEKAGMEQLLLSKKRGEISAGGEEIKCPPSEPCTASIPGIEITDLDDAAKVLWKAGIYAETGMGCTGPLVMMSQANYERATELLKAAGYIS
ncbi:MAG: glycine reductase [Oscillospiraceae bacterium]|nr:glycine reductase [Oscillospiraceae bacterium]